MVRELRRLGEVLHDRWMLSDLRLLPPKHDAPVLVQRDIGSLYAQPDQETKAKTSDCGNCS